MAKQKHLVFNIAYDGIARELRSSAVIRDPFTKKHIRLGKVIWDTGATSCAINKNVASKMGLIPTGQTQVSTAGGIVTANTYILDIHFDSRVGFQAVNVTDGDLGTQTDILIGMDIIGMGDFTVQNCDGKTHFSFAMPPFETKYNMLEKSEKVNKQIAKQEAREARKNK